MMDAEDIIQQIESTGWRKSHTDYPDDQDKFYDGQSARRNGFFTVCITCDGQVHEFKSATPDVLQSRRDLDLANFKVGDLGEEGFNQALYVFSESFSYTFDPAFISAFGIKITK